MAYTKGKWEIKDRGYNNWLVIESKGQVICQFFEEKQEYDASEEYKDFNNYAASAKLMAAAPQLLSALQHLLDVIDPDVYDISAAKDAIKQAIGD